jgi:hypothetical protein
MSLLTRPVHLRPAAALVAALFAIGAAGAAAATPVASGTYKGSAQGHPISVTIASGKVTAVRVTLAMTCYGQRSSHRIVKTLSVNTGSRKVHRTDGGKFGFTADIHRGGLSIDGAFTGAKLSGQVAATVFQGEGTKLEGCFTGKGTDVTVAYSATRG